ncbi:ADP-ribose diphosphatase [Motiliproteus coralliicola]|uniref:ADP-ribose pyrophosphatase n=1 Tax=Motiliproteus coralliicola TaxID=2283196 RepID=A0A369WPS6_9GAMM|nr:ADP-ribose diphosphatase [Motiliproteus coralliicola]RDE24080.1 ADP-ribose diphosphatase [Motiliproteus coralliicola]
MSIKNAPTFSTEDIELLQTERVYDGFFKLDRVQLRHRLFDGGWSDPLTRELFVRDDAVCLLPYDPVRDQVLLIEQFRVGALQDPSSPWLLELVAGIVEPGETVEQVALREAEEEAGLSVQRLEPICCYHVSPGGSQEQIHLLCGQIDSRDQGGIFGLAHEGEDIRALVVSRKEAFAAVTEGRINNAATLIALQWLQMNHQRLQQLWDSDKSGESENSADNQETAQ